LSLFLSFDLHSKNGTFWGYWLWYSILEFEELFFLLLNSLSYGLWSQNFFEFDVEFLIYNPEIF